MLSESRERFLRAILDRIPLERLVDVHLFPAIRQGQMETGVAVIAALPEPAAVATVPEPAVVVTDLAPAVIMTDSEPPIPAASSPDHDSRGRHVVYSASYRLTRKGPERGKWEVDVTLEADAPLPTVERVVRGVQERAGEELDPQRLTHDELDALTHEASWRLATA